MVYNIELPKNLDISKLQLSDVKSNSYGGKVVYINNNGKNLRIQIPEMTLCYGLCENEVIDNKTNEVIGHKYSTNFSFKGMTDDKGNILNKKLKIFHDMLDNLDNLILSKAIENSITWLKMKKINKETAEALYSNLIIKSKDKETQEPDGKYPDTFKGKIPFYENKFKTEVYNPNKELVDLKKNIVKGSTARAIIECTGVWFAGGKFGVGWKIIQMAVNIPEELSGYSIIESSDDEDDDIDIVEESDDSDED